MLGGQVADYLRRYSQELTAPRLVLGLARGGLPVAEQVALAVGAKLDVVVARRIVAEGRSVGAVTTAGPAVFHEGVRRADFAGAVERERAEARRLLAEYRGDRPPPVISGRTVILVDDGLTTGVSATAALQEVRRQGPAHLLFATPVCAAEAADELARDADAVLCARSPLRMRELGEWYQDFDEVSGGEMREILARWAGSEVRVPIEGGFLNATMEEPPEPRGIVLFAHGSGSSRQSPRNRMVSSHLNQAGYATVRLDLLTTAEAQADERTAQWRFDVGRLTERLVQVVDWLSAHHLPIGLFGASTGAAAALAAAAERPKSVAAVVSRGGRPDLAGAALGRVSVPVLLIVGGDDEIVVGLNESAAEALDGHAEVVVIPGASHLFAEPGKLERVAELTTAWFDRHLV